MSLDFSTLKEQVPKISTEVGAFIRQEFDSFNSEKLETKSKHNDLVSFVDREAEKRILNHLKNLIPDSNIISEEGNSEDPRLKNGYTWIVDPLDGTTNFIHGLPIFSISIALAKDGELVFGLVHELGKDEIFLAGKDQGSFLNGNSIQVSQEKNVSKALLVTGFPYEDFTKRDLFWDAIKNYLDNTHGVRRLGSAAVDLSYVAAGRFEGFFEYKLNPWDVAAGALIVTEAGGKVTDYSGERNYLFGGEIFAANQLHRELLQMFNDSWSPK